MVQEFIRNFIQSFKKNRILWIFAVGMLILALLSVITGHNRQKLVYRQSLDQVVATVEGTEVTLRDFAVYVAYQEAEVEAQARVYDSENTGKYWGLHTNGQFIKFAARDAALSMAIHDRLFYLLSEEYNITLTEEEIEILNNDVMDFWSDLTEYGKDFSLGITKDDVYNTMYKIAIAEKCQRIYTELDNVTYEDYNFAGEDFQNFLADFEYEINESVLERIDFGDITLNH